MQAPKFKRGDKVKTPKGRGEVAKITKTEKGVWYTVTHKEGSTKMRGASLSPGFTCVEFMGALVLTCACAAVFAKGVPHAPKAEKPATVAKGEKQSFGARMAALRAEHKKH